MSKISTSSFQKGIFIEFKDEPYQIVDLTFVNPGKGSAFVRTKLKSVKTGKVTEFTFKSGETVEELPIYVKEMQYLYKKDDEYFFMDSKNYNQLSLLSQRIGPLVNYLSEGETYQLLIFQEKAIGLKYPKKVKIKISEAEEGLKGDTVSGAKKLVILETGVKIAVPLFLKKGDIIAVDPQSGEYLERVGKL